MINPNKGATEETLRRLREESYERLRIELFDSIKRLLKDFQMTWDDLAAALKWDGCYGTMTGDEIREEIGWGLLTTDELNQIAHCFSAEIYVIFRPRFPFINS